MQNYSHWSDLLYLIHKAKILHILKNNNYKNYFVNLLHIRNQRACPVFFILSGFPRTRLLSIVYKRDWLLKLRPVNVNTNFANVSLSVCEKINVCFAIIFEQLSMKNCIIQSIENPPIFVILLNTFSFYSFDILWHPLQTEGIWNLLLNPIYEVILYNSVRGFFKKLKRLSSEEDFAKNQR